MEALLPALLGAAAGEVGERPQRLARQLAERFGRNGPVLAGIALAATANALIAGAAGGVIAQTVNHRATLLLLALSLVFAGGGALWPLKARRERIDLGRAGPFVASAFAFFVMGFGDKTQFLLLGLAAASGSPWVTAAGGASGTLLASGAAVVAGAALRPAPLGRVRLAVAVLFLLAGLWVGVGALGLA